MTSGVEFTVSAADAGQRLDRFLAVKLVRFSRARIQRLIGDGFVKMNGTVPRAREIVRAGDHILFDEPPPVTVALEPERIPLSILFEDDDLIVLNKPAGIPVHPGGGKSSGTLVNALLAHRSNLSGIGGKERPGIVHRLDKETSGCLVVAKNDATHCALSKQFATRTVEKIYLALIRGKLPHDSGRIQAAIGRHPVHRKKMAVTDRGRSARTDYKVLRSGLEVSLIECRLHSGRTHQIRVHFAHLGHPILGDKLYGGRRVGHFPRQMLHAWKLAFDHPRGNERLNFEAPIPEDFEAALLTLF